METMLANQDQISQGSQKIQLLKAEIAKVIVGQEYMVDRVLIGLLTEGHVLIEGIPGLAKTLLASTLSEVLGISYQRIQFTPDLLPADILGTEIYHQKTSDFVVKKGAIFSNMVLADEINRAPAKVQSALLEAMQEKQVTIGDTTYMLDRPFIVVATQNPLEQQGTYPLPEAQQDRFMLKLKVSYPSREEEKAILVRFTQGGEKKKKLNQVLSSEEILYYKQLIETIHVDEAIADYVLDIVQKTRADSPYISCGASPRATLNLIRAAKGRAFMMGRNYVMPDDVKAMAYDVLRHRILLTYEAEAEEMTTEKIISHILEHVVLG